MFDDSGAGGSAREAPAPAPEPAVARFRACRWHDESDGGAEYCRHGEVLPYTGRNGFSPQAWCLDCAFYKARRKTTPRRDAEDLDDLDF